MYKGGLGAVARWRKKQQNA